MACFFGFGSLVNTATHKYVAISPARVAGWSRAWVNDSAHEHAFLSVIPAPEFSIQGLFAAVPNNDWAELDARESGYKRRKLSPNEWTREIPTGRLAESFQLIDTIPSDIQMYEHAVAHLARGEKPILYSYIETVLYGYYQWFDVGGMTDFIESTTAWTEIFDDRKSPVYPRYVPADQSAAAAVNTVIESLRS